MKHKSLLFTLLALAAFWGSVPGHALAAFGPITQINVALNGDQPNDDSSSPAVNGDGSVIAFVSKADNLVGNDTNLAADVFILDRRTGTLTRIVGPDGEFQDDSDAPAVSDDGNLIAFTTAGALRVFNRQFGEVQEIIDRFHPPYAFSGNGRFLVITADDDQGLDPNDQNGFTDVYVFDRLQGSYELVSRAPGGGGNSNSFSPSITPDGRFVAFVSDASNLVADDIGQSSMFVYDRIGATTERVSGFGPDEANLLLSAMPPALSADARFVSYLAVDTVGNTNLYLRDRTAGTTTRLGVSVPSNPPNFSTNTRLTMSRNGRRFVFGIIGFVEEVYLFDMDSATTILVSAAVGGSDPDSDSISAQFSGDGRSVVFVSDAITLVPSGPDGGTMNVFLATPNPSPRGDVNGDGKVDAADLLALIRMVFGGVP